MRVLVVTNFVPDAGAPQRGQWVRDQVEEMRRRGLEIEVFSFPPGSSHYVPATWRLRRLLRRQRFDVVHAHYGLPGWCARLAGARPLIVSFHGTDVRHRVVGALSRRLARRVDLTAAVSRALFDVEEGRPGLPHLPGSAVSLRAGPRRFGPISRTEARAAPRAGPRRPLSALPRRPARPEKRSDRARELASRLHGPAVDRRGDRTRPDAGFWINAANAVLVTSDYEGFGLAALEALACDVPVPLDAGGIAPFALVGLPGPFARHFESAWAAAAPTPLEAADPRVEGIGPRRRCSPQAAPAERTIEAYRDVLAPP